MLILASYDYESPSSVCEVMDRLDGESRLIAGGSDLLPQLKYGVINPKRLIDLGRVEALRQVREAEDGIHIGAASALSDLAENPLIAEKLPALAAAVRNVASPQIRNRGTLAGNVLQARRCFYYNQSREWRKGIPRCLKLGGNRCIQIPNSPGCRAIYYSDAAPALLAYRASAVVETAEGETVRAAADIVREHCEDRERTMLIKEFVIPRESYEHCWSGFYKYSLRGGIDFPVVNFAGRAAREEIDLYAGAISTDVVRLEDTGRCLLEGRQAADLERAVETATAEMKKKSRLIREAGISVQVKRGAFSLIRELLSELLSNDFGMEKEECT